MRSPAGFERPGISTFDITMIEDSHEVGLEIINTYLNRKYNKKLTNEFRVLLNGIAKAGGVKAKTEDLHLFGYLSNN